MAAACKQGERKAQKALFEALSPKMMAVCLRYMGNREDAEDVLQEAFIILFTKLDSYQGAGSFEGWARRIFVNTALMHLRRTDALGLSDDIEEARSLFTQEATPVQKMAKELGCTEATSRSKLQRARIRLQEMIRENK